MRNVRLGLRAGANSCGRKHYGAALKLPRSTCLFDLCAGAAVRAEETSRAAGSAMAAEPETFLFTSESVGEGHPGSPHKMRRSAVPRASPAGSQQQYEILITIIRSASWHMRLGVDAMRRNHVTGVPAHTRRRQAVRPGVGRCARRLPYPGPQLARGVRCVHSRLMTCCILRRVFTYCASPFPSAHV